MSSMSPTKEDDDLSKVLPEGEIKEKLREYHKIYNDRKKKFSLRFQPNNKAEGDLGTEDGHLDFFLMTYKNVFTEAPETQSRFLQVLYENIVCPIKPPSLPLYSDLITKRIRKSIENKSYPFKIRELLCKHFFRRIAALKQQKYKTMQRFAHFCRVAEQESYAELFISDRMNVLDEEILTLEQRYNRLKKDDFFSESVAFPDKKPKQKMLNDFMMLTLSADTDSSISNIAKDDIMCYLREIVYNRKLSRPLKKFVYNIKWMHLSNRFQIFQEAHDNINETRLKGEYAFKEFLETYRSIIVEYLAQEDKNDQGWGTFLGELLSLTEDDPYPSLANVKDYPPIVATTRTEMSKILEPLSKKYKIDWSGSDNMQSFLFTIANIFKVIFDNQAKIYPSVTNDMSQGYRGGSQGSEYDDNSPHRSSQEDRKSDSQYAGLLDRVMLEEERIKKDLIENKLTREPHRVKETPCSWLKELVYKREVPPEEKHYYQVIELQKYHDVNLKNLIDLISQNDIELTNSTIGDKVSQARTLAEHKLTNYIENYRYRFKSRGELVDKFLDVTIEDEEKILEKMKENHEFDYLDQKLRNRKEQGGTTTKNDYIREIKRILRDEAYKHCTTLEGIYQLQVLDIRTSRRRLLSILNAMRSIQRKLALDLFQIQSSNFFKKDPETSNIGSYPGFDRPSSTRKSNKKPQGRRGFFNMSMLSFRSKEISSDFEEELESLVCRADRISYEIPANVDEEGCTEIQEVFVVDDKNAYLLYTAAREDLQKLEAEMLKLGTYFIDKFEQSRRYTKAELQHQAILADRTNVLLDLYEYEARFQFSKLRLIEEYYEIYEHVTDPLEQYKMMGTIFDLMAQRPLIDFEAGYFRDCFENEIKIKKKTTKIIRALKTAQMEYETEENHYFCDVMEKFLEQSEDFQAYLNSLHEAFELRKLEKGKPINESNATMSDQHASQATIKNYKQYTAKDIMDLLHEIKGNQPNEKDKKSIKSLQFEKNNHTKYFQGGPYPFAVIKNLMVVKFTQSSHLTSLLDFYGSFVNLTRILPVLESSLQEFTNKFKPQNNTILTSMRNCFFDTVLKEVQQFDFSQKYYNIESNPIIDDCSSLEEIISTVSQAVNGAKIDPDYLYQLDVNFIESKLYNNKPIINLIYDKDDHRSSGNPYQRHRDLYLYCNMIELLRLREELLFSVHENSLLEKIYMAQRKTGKLDTSQSILYFPKPVSLDEKGARFHRVDLNDGSELNLPFKAFKEFDEKLNAYVDFCSTKCIGYLILKDQLEDLRVTTKYEVMNREILIYEITRNQVVLDYPQQVMLELDILLRPSPPKYFDMNSRKTLSSQLLTAYRIGKPTLDFERIYLNEPNIHRLKLKMNELVLTLKNKFKPAVEWKTEGRTFAEKQYANYQANMTVQLEELKAKRLRNFRRYLADLYVDDVVKRLQIESNKLTLINISDKIKQLIQVIPENYTCFRVNSAPFHEIDIPLYSDQKKFTQGVNQDELPPSETLMDDQQRVRIPYYIFSPLEIVEMQTSQQEIKAYNWRLQTLDTKAYAEKEAKVFDTVEIKGGINSEWITYGLDPSSRQQKEDWIKRVIIKNIRMKDKSPLSRTYLNVKETSLYKLIKYYRYLFDFLQQKYFALLFDFSNEENVLLTECLLFSKQFPQPRQVAEQKALAAENEGQLKREVSGENEWRSAIKEIIEDKDTYKHMYVLLCNIKDDLAETYNGLKTRNIKGLNLQSLITYFQGESHFFYRKLPLILNMAYKEVLERIDVVNLLQVGEELKQVFLPSKVNGNLRLRFLDFMHMARNSISDVDFLKEVPSNYSEFECFYQHVRRKKKDKANTRLQIVCSYFQYQIRKHYFKEERRKWSKIDFRDNEDLDYIIKDVRTASANIFGTPNYVQSPNLFKCVAPAMELEQNNRQYVGMFLKGKDGQLRDYYYYKCRKRELKHEDYYSTLFLKTDFENQLEALTLFIQLWQRQEPFMMIPAYYQKQVEEIKSVVMKNADVERAKIRKVELGRVILDIPKRYEHLFFKADKEIDGLAMKRTQQEVHLNAEIEMNLIFSTVEHMCLQRWFERLFLNSSIKVFGEETSTLSLLIRSFEDDIERIKKEAAPDGGRYRASSMDAPKINHYFSSLLVKVPKVETNTLNQIPDLHLKVTAVQIFINRLRNRASKVSTLGDEAAYMIKAFDLDECLSKLVKQLVDKENLDKKTRDETMRLRLTELNNEVDRRGTEVQILKSKLNSYKSDLERMSDAKMHEKSNSLIFEMDALLRDFVKIKAMIIHLEEKLTKVIEAKFIDRLQAYERDIEMMKEKCKNWESEIKTDMIVKLRIVADKLAKFINEKAAEVLKVSLEDLQQGTDIDKFEDNELMDVVEMKKAMNRMRMFWILKFNLQKERHAKYKREMDDKLDKAHSNYEELVEAKKREFYIRKELNHLQRTLDYQEKLNKELTAKLSEINMDRVRLERFNEVRGKKLERLENEAKEIKFVQNVDVTKLLDNYQKQEAEIDVLRRKEEKFEAMMRTMERSNQVKMNAMKKTLQEEISVKNQVLMKEDFLKEESQNLILTHKDNASLWMEKCQDLMGENREQKTEIHRLNDRIKYLESKLTEKSGSPSKLNFTSHINSATYGQFLQSVPSNDYSLGSSYLLNESDKVIAKYTSPFAKPKLVDRQAAPISVSSAGKDIYGEDRHLNQHSDTDERKKSLTPIVVHRREKSMLPQLQIRERKSEGETELGAVIKKNAVRGSLGRQYRKMAQAGALSEWGEEAGKSVNLSVIEKSKINTGDVIKDTGPIRGSSQEPKKKNYKNLNNSLL